MYICQLQIPYSYIKNFYIFISQYDYLIFYFYDIENVL